MAFHYSAKEFIKVYRKLLDWEWYTDVNTKTLFLHCLLRANWKAGEWKGVHYEAGEFITSLAKISEETGLTIRQARVALSHLEMTGELTSRTTDRVTSKKLNRFRIITVNNWDSYQGSDKQNDKQNDKQDVNQTAGKRQATRQASDNRYKNIKNIKEDKNKEKENIKEKEIAPVKSAKDLRPDDFHSYGEYLEEYGRLLDEELYRKRGGRI